MSNSFAQQSDLEIALGGADVLVQLADRDGDGIADDSVVTDYLESGAAEVRAALEVKHDPETIANLDSPSLRRLVDANAALSARISYWKGSKGMAVPSKVDAAAERADDFLDMLARGLRRLGRVSGGKVAALGQPVGVVDHDPNGDGGFTLSGAPAGRISIAGLKRGFR